MKKNGAAKDQAQREAQERAAVREAKAAQKAAGNEAKAAKAREFSVAPTLATLAIFTVVQAGETVSQRLSVPTTYYVIYSDYTL